MKRDAIVIYGLLHHMGLDMINEKLFAEGEKAIVRFEGDTYWSDLVVTAEDKAVITEVLDTYEMMR